MNVDQQILLWAILWPIALRARARRPLYSSAASEADRDLVALDDDGDDPLGGQVEELLELVRLVSDVYLVEGYPFTGVILFGRRTIGAAGLRIYLQFFSHSGVFYQMGGASGGNTLTILVSAYPEGLLIGSLRAERSTPHL